VLFEMVLYALLLRFTAKKICTACSRTRNKSAPITYLNKHINSNKSEIEVHINSSEKIPKKTLRISGDLVTTAGSSAFYVSTSCYIEFGSAGL
jgi:hypothetical protein